MREWITALWHMITGKTLNEMVRIRYQEQSRVEFERYMKRMVAIAMAEGAPTHTSRFKPHGAECTTGECLVELKCTRDGCETELPPGQPSYAVRAFKAAPNGVEHWYEEEGPLCHECVTAIMREAQSL